MPVPANKLLADFIDIYDRNLSHTYKRQTPKVRAAFNKLRRSVGKAELKDDPSTRAGGVEDPVVTYFTAETTTDPAVVSFPTSGLKGISFAGSSFTSGSWNIPQNGKVSFNYVQDVFQDAFYPVSLQLTAAAAPNTTVTLKVNDVDLLTPDYPISQAVGTTVGVFDFFVPAPCFIGGTNTFILTTTAGFISNITKIEVVSATGTGDVNATITALSQSLARLGAENGVIKNAWPQIVSTCQSFPQLASFVSRAQTLQSDFNTLYSNMKQSAIDLKSFCDMYYTLYLPILIDPDTTRQDKLDVVADAQQSVANAKGTTLATITSLSNYKIRLQTFQTDIQNAATSANIEIQKELNKIAWDIAQCRLELSALQAKFNTTAAALGLTFFAGAVGIWASLAFLGPLGPFAAIGVAIVAVIGIAVSVGFLIDLGIKINNKQSELNDLLEEQADLIAQQQQIQQMMGKVTDISQSLVQVSQYTNAFKELWEFIETQLMGIETQFNNFPTISTPSLFQRYIERWNNTMEPYFTKIITVLDAYINNFP